MIAKLGADLPKPPPVTQSAYWSVGEEHMGIATAAEIEEALLSLLKVSAQATRPPRRARLC